MSTFTRRVANTNDDGYKRFGTWRTTALYVGDDSYFGDDIGAVRFNNVTVPKNATITSAKITFKATGTSSYQYYLKVRGIAEDDTADFSSDPTGRSTTSAAVDWDPNGFTDEADIDTSNIGSIVQEIVNRAGWASGNDMGFLIFDDGGSGHEANLYDYADSSSYCALLTIEYSTVSPSSSVSPSRSPSASASPSASTSPSPSRSVSPSTSVSPSSSPSPSPMPPANPSVLKIAKTGVNVLTNSDVEKFKFNSEYGTLKYFHKEAINLTINALADDVGCTGEYVHNLDKYLYCEVYVSVYIGSPTGIYEYCPFAGAGATILYDATYKIEKNKIVVYGQLEGMGTELWHFDFLIFVFNNDLNL